MNFISYGLQKYNNFLNWQNIFQDNFIFSSFLCSTQFFVCFFVCCAIIFEIFLLHFVQIFFKLKQFCTPFSSKHPCGTKKRTPEEVRFSLIMFQLTKDEYENMSSQFYSFTHSLFNSLILSLFTFLYRE